MSGRFEKIIAGAVIVGALSLAGCGGGGGGGTPAEEETPDTTAPTLLGGRTLSTTQIELTFSEAVTAGASAAGFFTLSGNNRTIGLSYVDSASGVCAYTSSPGVWVNCDVVGVYSFSEPATIPIGSVSVSPSDSAKLLVDLGAAIVESDDGGTGTLRLSYTTGDAGVEDEAGNALADIVLDSTQVGNVLDGTGTLQMVSARTIDASTIELAFSEPVTTSDAVLAAGQFAIQQNCVGYYSNPDSFRSAYFLLPANTYFPSGGSYSVAGLSIPSEGGGYLVRLTTGSPIPDTFDFGGYLRLTYDSTGSLMEDEDGIPLGDIAPDVTHRGNVEDTLGANGSCAVNVFGG